MRRSFGEALVQLGKINPHIVVLTADLGESTQAKPFQNTFPNRFFDVGVAEQNLMGVSAGLAASGLIPFCTSYATFSPGRNWEQLRNTVCYSNLNVKVVATHVGLTVGPDGATHQALEDIAITRPIPNLIILSPLDYHQTYRATIAAANHYGPVYLRLPRENNFSITTTTTPFELGKAQILRFGQAVTIVATGLMVGEALKAAEEIDAEIINVHTIKPLDINTIHISTQKTKHLIIIEEHQQAGGLGSALFEAFALQGWALPPTKHLAVADRFGQSGTPDELLNAYGLTFNHIIEKYHQFTYTNG